MKNTFKRDSTNKELNSFYNTINTESQDPSVLFHSYEKLLQFNNKYMQQQKKIMLKKMYI